MQNEEPAEEPREELSTRLSVGESSTVVHGKPWMGIALVGVIALPLVGLLAALIMVTAH